MGKGLMSINPFFSDRFLADPVGRFNPSSGWANERARWLVSQAPGNHPAADQQGSVSWSQETNCQRGGARKKRFIWAREICLKPNFFKVLLLALRISNFESTNLVIFFVGLPAVFFTWKLLFQDLVFFAAGR